ncbi:hypothetical protein [Cellulomonas terrae]|nr:hypothetical protein [Cellulomonas terrae]
MIALATPSVVELPPTAPGAEGPGTWRGTALPAAKAETEAAGAPTDVDVELLTLEPTDDGDATDAVAAIPVMPMAPTRADAVIR